MNAFYHVCDMMQINRLPLFCRKVLGSISQRCLQRHLTASKTAAGSSHNSTKEDFKMSTMENENTEEKEQDIVNQGVESRIFVPYTGKISEIHMLDSGKEVAFTEADGGLTLTIPAGYRQGSAPIALVFEMKKAE